MSSCLGIFGGTFDPVHYGHLRCALEVSEALAIPVNLLPAGQPPHRPAPLASPQHRLKMLQIALAEQSHLGLDQREIERPGSSFMVDTLENIRADEPDKTLALIVGADAFSGLHRWHRWKQLAQLAHIVVMARPGHNFALDPVLQDWCADRWTSDLGALKRTTSGALMTVSVSALDISASDIRDRLARGASPRYLLPDAVLAYILQHRLYGIELSR